MQVHSGISSDLSGVQWRKLDITLDESDWSQLIAHGSAQQGMSVPAKFDMMRKKADQLLIFWMLREGMLTKEQAVQQLKELSE